MIQVAGSVSRSFLFPASREIAANYYQDFKRVVKHLSLISMVKQIEADKFRVMYNSTELGIYNIKIYCDVQTIFDENESVLIVQTIDDHPKMPAKSGWNSSEAHGAFASQSVFYKEGDQTRIEYKLHLRAVVPPPLALRVVPTGVLDQIAGNITAWRMDTIVDQFVRSTIKDYHRSHPTD